MDFLTPIIADTAFRTLSKALDAGQRAIATGSVGASVSLLATALHQQTNRPVLVVCAHVDEAEDVLAETHAVGGSGSEVFPALELAPGESSVSAELFANRAAMIAQIRTGAIPDVLIAPIAALMQPVPSAQRIDELVREINRGDRLDPRSLIEWMSTAGYERVEAVEYPGQFASRGGIIDIFPTSGSGGSEPMPVRLDFFGDELDAIAEIDLDTMGSDRRIEKVLLGAAGEVQLKATSNDRSVLEYLSQGTIVLIAETFEVIEQGRGYFERISDGRVIFGPPAVLKLLETRFHALCEVNQFSAGKSGADALVALPVETLPPFDKEVSIAIGELAELRGRVDTVVLACGSEGEFARMGELLTLHAPGIDIRREIFDVRRGFVWDGSDPGAGIGRYALVPSGQMLHRSSVRRRMQRLKAGRAMDTFLDIQPDDYVVHSEHGIARFVGLTVMDASGTAKTKVRYSLKPEKSRKNEGQEEYLTLEFAGRSKLHVPCSQIDLVQKYVGGFKGKPPLSSIGGKKWKAQKERVSESVKDLASEMLRVRAAREHVPGFSYPVDTSMFAEFEAEFPYDETEDQLATMIEIKKDMQSSRPMDRLICGDVGFGKTELAIRAAFKAIEAGRQVAVLVPTTVLAEQHERTFRNRFADFPFRVESLSRFKTPGQIRKTLQDVQLGRVDVVVGTHRLLSDDVRFAELGMVIIDEEQRFGVEHKEKLLRLRLTVDVLTLSATPIPRTLHMSMLGLRDISSLTTPPVDRRSIVTEVIPYNPHRVARAIQRELAREGQVYFVHNRVHNIQSVADNIRQLVPDANVIIGHGQMNPHDLEQVMYDFMSRRADVLVSTTIIESGIDIPTANTMIINDADRFGLSELHQLRGRVGRSHHRAYCYLLLPEDRTVKEVAQKRLKAIEEYSMLGAGFKIAMRDLEIRGAGNLLGAEQSGHIAAVGYEMYCQLLDQTVQRLTSDGTPEPIEHTSVDIGVFGYIPKAYIPSDTRRIEAYRRLGNARSQAQLDQVLTDITSAYSDPPELVRRLILRARLRAAAQDLHIRSIGLREKDIVLLTAHPDRVSVALEHAPAQVRVVEAQLAQTNARASGGKRLSEIYLRENQPSRSPMQRAKSLLSWMRTETVA